jgi:hypothetical protein
LHPDDAADQKPDRGYPALHLHDPYSATQVTQTNINAAAQLREPRRTRPRVSLSGSLLPPNWSNVPARRTSAVSRRIDSGRQAKLQRRVVRQP